MYSVVANEIVDGGRPYVDAVERKPPLLFWTYAAVFKVAGKYQLESAPRSRTRVDAMRDGRPLCNRLRVI